MTLQLEINDHLVQNWPAIVDGAVEILAAIRLLEGHGYKVTKARAPKANGHAPKLNAIGRPYGASFDPKYRMKHKTPSISNRQGNSSMWSGLTAEQWAFKCANAKEWWEHSRRHGTPLPYDTDLPVPK